MRTKLLILFLVFLLAGCGSDGENVVLPTRAESAVNGPRDVLNPPTPNLPPTWTPAPVQVQSTAVPAADSGSTDTTDVTDDQQTHVVQAGDTLGEIAAQYNVTLSDLVEANDIDNIDVIEVGTVLIIPTR